LGKRKRIKSRSRSKIRNRIEKKSTIKIVAAED
jgi:hypothetical protein